MFVQFKQAMQQHFNSLLAKSQQVLYRTDVNPDHLWETYLQSFPEEERQEYNCNACKQFIRHYGGLVAIVDGHIETIWDFQCEPPYDGMVVMLAAEVGRARITDLFFSTFAGLGTDKNFVEGKTTGDPIITWEHMHFKLPKSMVQRGSESVESLMGKARDNRNVFKRGLDEITMDAVETVLDLIAQNSLYRGEESKGMLTTFKNIKHIYDSLPLPDVDDTMRENWAWKFAPQHAGAVAGIRNTAIGTLLVDISKGENLDRAVGAFERIMAPTNYKRPNAVITQRMIEAAEKTIGELGYTNSLGRRFATVDDLTVNKLLFVDRDIKKSMGLLGDLKATAGVNPKSLSKMEEIGIEAFRQNIIPVSTSVAVLFENKHINNLVSLITAADRNAPGLFKWNNPFSWSYKNAVTDSIKEKVKTAGGTVEGELRVSLEWYNFDDLDLHVIEPDGNEIYFRNKRSYRSNGCLDVDMNAGSGTTREAVENIIWPSANGMREGKYRVIVNQYAPRETVDIGFSVEIECQGQVLNFSHAVKISSGYNVHVAEFEWSRSKGIKLIASIEGTAKIQSKTVWGVDTNQFHKVSMIMRSPNHWDLPYNGNAHYFFILDQAHNDEQARGFFNEFLKPELEAHKRVFEALGGRMKVEPADKQVTGLGFSVTQHTDLIVKVDGHFNRTLKLVF